MTFTLEFDHANSLEMDDLEVEAVIEPKAGDIIS
jgi:hypothetical protein